MESVMIVAIARERRDRRGGPSRGALKSDMLSGQGDAMGKHDRDGPQDLRVVHRRAAPGRTNIVVTRDAAYREAGSCSSRLPLQTPPPRAIATAMR